MAFWNLKLRFVCKAPPCNWLVSALIIAVISLRVIVLIAFTSKIGTELDLSIFLLIIIIINYSKGVHAVMQGIGIYILQRKGFELKEWRREKKEMTQQLTCPLIREWEC